MNKILWLTAGRSYSSLHKGLQSKQPGLITISFFSFFFLIIIIIITIFKFMITTLFY